jgi:chromosome segregation ATPase
VAQLPADDLEARVRSLEQAVGQLRDEVMLTRTDAAAARELAAGADRDVSEVRAELRAHTQALTALRENQLDMQSEMRQGFTKVNAGMSLIVELLGRTSGDDIPEP